MRILYSDDHSIQQGGPICLILLNDVWHVVARGYLCRVETEEEGRQVGTALKTRQEGLPSRVLLIV